MGKDESGKFHPGKGKPSGVNREEGLGLAPTDPEKMNNYIDITNRYTLDADELAPNVHLRHPNRNTSKGEDNYKGKENTEESNKSRNQTFTEERTPVIPMELPGVLTRELFIELAGYKAEQCISIYIDTHQSGVLVNEHFDPVNFKNYLDKAAEKLGQMGLSHPEIKTMLEPGYTLLRNENFWLDMSPGLALFISKDYFRYIKMPVVPGEEIVADNSFYVTQLLPVIMGNEYFYLLVLSKKQVKLYKVNPFGIDQIKVNGLPNGMDDAQADDKDETTTYRMGGRGGTGGANFHGIGGGNHNDDKTKIATYFEMADDVIWKQVLHNETAPLLLAGVEYLIPIYRSVTDYNHLWNDAITGSHEHEHMDALFKKANEIMQPFYETRKEEALEEYGNKSVSALTSSIIDDIIPAAYFSRISVLFVAKGEHIWGIFDEMNNTLRLHNSSTEGGEDLIDNAVVKTILNGGEVILLDKEKMPADSPLAAIMRY